MLPARRAAVRTAQHLRTGPQRRFESSHGESHAHDTHHHAEPVNESLGNRFFLTLALIPLGLGIYSATAGEGKYPSFLTRTIQGWTEKKEEWVRRNALHTQMVEQAAFDRNLFHNSEKGKPVAINLRFPESFNAGSPYAVHAGDQVDLSELIRHYENVNREKEEEGKRESGTK